MRRVLSAVTLVMIGSLLGCAPKAYVRAGFLDAPPKSLAVLPFTITYAYDLAAGQAVPESHVIGSRALRKTFYYALTPLGYQDRKPADVDAALDAKWGSLEQGQWKTATAQQLGQALSVEAVIYGDLARLMHFSTPLYTETSLTANLRMVDTRSGEVLWRKRVKVAERGGALVQKGQVVDFVQDQMRSYNPEVKFLRVSDIAVRSLMKDFPNPTLGESLAHEPAASTSRPQLALLPLATKSPADAKSTDTLRRYLAASLQESPFEVIELQLVDEVLSRQPDGVAKEAAALAVANALGADVVLQGTVTSWGRTYAVVESWAKAELELTLLDGQTGQTLWSAKRKNTRQAGILKGPTGYKSLATAPISGMKKSHLQRVANDLTRMMVSDMSASPAVLTYVGEWQPE